MDFLVTKLAAESEWGGDTILAIPHAALIDLLRACTRDFETATPFFHCAVRQITMYPDELHALVVYEEECTDVLREEIFNEDAWILAGGPGPHPDFGSAHIVDFRITVYKDLDISFSVDYLDTIFVSDCFRLRELDAEALPRLQEEGYDE